MNIQREYKCNNHNCCHGMIFSVFHSDMKKRQRHCAYCGQKPKETGRYWRVWSKNVIGYDKRGNKFEIFKRKDLK